MMKIVIVICFLVIPVVSFSQELRLSSNLGYVTGEMKAFKKIMLYTGVDLGVELDLKNSLRFTALGGVSLLRFDYTDTASNAVFNSKYFFNTMVSLKKYYPVSKKSWLFWDFGVLASYQFSDKKEIRSTAGDAIRKRDNLGFNFGLLVAFGFKTILTSRLSVDIGLAGQTDYLVSYNNMADEIKTDKRMLVISFYRKLK